MSPSITLSLSFDIIAMRAGDWMVILKACLMALTFSGSMRIIRLQDDEFLKRTNRPYRNTLWSYLSWGKWLESYTSYFPTSVCPGPAEARGFLSSPALKS